MKHKVTYKIDDAVGFLALCQRMNETFIPTGSRVYAEMRVVEDTDWDYVVHPYLHCGGEPLREFLTLFNKGITPVGIVEPLYAGDSCFEKDEATPILPVKDDDSIDCVTYVESHDRKLKINLIFTFSLKEFGSWCAATDTLKWQHDEAVKVIWDKEYRVKRFKQLRDAHMRSCPAPVPMPF